LWLCVHVFVVLLLKLTPVRARARDNEPVPSHLPTAVAGKSSNGATNNGATTAREFWRSAGRRAVAGCAAVAACRVPYLPIIILHWLYALVLSLTMGALWDAYCALATAVFGVDAAPSFAAPWLSASFADYWGRCVVVVYLWEEGGKKLLLAPQFDKKKGPNKPPRSPPPLKAAGT
jgi:hypothetical protein